MENQSTRTRVSRTLLNVSMAAVAGSPRVCTTSNRGGRAGLGLCTILYTAYSCIFTAVIQYENKPDPYHKLKSQTVDGMVRQLIWP